MNLLFITLLVTVLVASNGFTLHMNRGQRVTFHSWNMPESINGVSNPKQSRFSTALNDANLDYPPLKSSNIQELVQTANAMVSSGKGLLACDESTGTIGTRLESIGLQNTMENRQKWRELLFTTPKLSDHVSGAILYEETLYQDSSKGTPFVKLLQNNNIIPGIKVDTGLKPLIGGVSGEKWCSGLDDLADRTVKYYQQGARFAKWRAALSVNVVKGMPSNLAVEKCANGLAMYARICQEAGLVPIIEPEILLDGDHDIATTSRVQELVISAVYKSCINHGVHLEGTLLKPSMTLPGVDCTTKTNPKEIAEYTVKTLERVVPVQVPGITFLSGGISEEDSTIYLSEINKIKRKGPWAMTFSFSRALQASVLDIWMGKDENVDAAKAQLFARCKANSEASKGVYAPGSAPSLKESLYVKDYQY